MRVERIFLRERPRHKTTHSATALFRQRQRLSTTLLRQQNNHAKYQHPNRTRLGNSQRWTCIRRTCCRSQNCSRSYPCQGYGVGCHGKFSLFFFRFLWIVRWLFVSFECCHCYFDVETLRRDFMKKIGKE